MQAIEAEAGLENVIVIDAKVNSGSSYINHTIGDNATVKIALSVSLPLKTDP